MLDNIVINAEKRFKLRTAEKIASIKAFIAKEGENGYMYMEDFQANLNEIENKYSIDFSWSSSHNMAKNFQAVMGKEEFDCVHFVKFVVDSIIKHAENEGAIYAKQTTLHKDSRELLIRCFHNNLVTFSMVVNTYNVSEARDIREQLFKNDFKIYFKDGVISA